MKRDNSASFKQNLVLPWIELRVANRSSACYDAHSHDEFSFGVILQGTAAYKNRSQSHQVGAGDLVTINPADVHSCNPEKGLWSYSMLFVDALKMGQLQRDILRESNQRLPMDYHAFNADFERNEALKAQYFTLFNALEHEESNLNIETCLYSFIESSLQITRPSFKHRQHDEPIKRIREKLLDEVAHHHELESLAEEAGMSRYQLLRAFKNQYGLPPYAYLMDEKIKRSKVMLKAGDSLSDVAHNLGFSDQAHFQRQFKKRLAVTPKYYQSHFVGVSS
ncbi:AraC family transcriptional regulator [Vibrio aquaticus]|uniref:AraC family transcriptional regulator n=1 Tax=Vibrio aquaticus TaxID=2496559 RepID=A0A3S0ML62_9VIBR|nr:AraC family transcriptional regulator [Vibrio aquaticus]RTZ17621.1 AraC family transcriptional regulator [Vibrio aquaticus]